MYIVGQKEIDAVTRVIETGALFRYGVGKECDTFEERYARYLGCKHFALAASGSNALAAAMIGVGLGPGDEVLIPAHTYMATATSVLAVGAIPVIVDIDESLTMDPAALEAAIRPRTRAVIPVHMWGAACDMAAIMEIARRHDLIVIEDACQGVGGGYEGKKFGTIGHVGAFSFNYFKNMTCGEGGGVSVNDDVIAERARCAIDPCHFYWQGRNDAVKPFAGNGARPSELMGAMLNAQLDRLEGMITAMRAEKKQILAGTASLDNLGPPCHADEQPGLRVRHPRHVHAAHGRCGEPLRQDFPERHRRQDRPPQLHRMGPGADGRGRRAPGHEPVQHAGERRMPAHLFQGHVREVPRDLEPDRDGADPPGARPEGNRRHRPQHQRRGAHRACRHVGRRGGAP